MILGKCDCKGKIVVVISKMRIWYHSVKPRLKSLSFPLLGTVTSFSLTLSFFGTKCSASSLTVWLKAVTAFLTVQSVQMSVSILAGCKMLLTLRDGKGKYACHDSGEVTRHTLHKVAWNHSHPNRRSNCTQLLSIFFHKTDAFGGNFCWLIAARGLLWMWNIHGALESFQDPLDARGNDEPVQSRDVCTGCCCPSVTASSQSCVPS